MINGLSDLLSRLIDRHVDFVVVGGFAAVAHGCTLLTQDIDICCDFSEDNLLKLQRAVADLHPVHRMTPQRLPLKLTRKFCKGLKNLYLDTDYGPLDCLSSVLGIGEFAVVKEQSTALNTGIRVLSLDALIKAKKAMGRDRDKTAVIQLEAIKNLADTRRS